MTDPRTDQLFLEEVRRWEAKGYAFSVPYTDNRVFVSPPADLRERLMLTDDFRFPGFASFQEAFAFVRGFHTRGWMEEK